MDRAGDDQTPPTLADREDSQTAAEAAALGKAGISKTTGTGSAGSGLAAGGGEAITGTSYHATTGGTTESDGMELGETAGPSAAFTGGTGTAGSGLGAPSTSVNPAPGQGGGTASGATGATGSPGSAGMKGTNSGGSEAGGGGGLGSA
jgi:hypothetical protein